VKWQGLLVSVRDPVEARAALDGGAAVIDVKDPSAGPLGAAAAETIAAIAATVGSAVPWTHACGELVEGGAGGTDGVTRILHAVEEAHSLCRLRSAVPAAAVKAGMSATIGLAWPQWLARIAAGLPAGTSLVAVVYADWQTAGAPPPHDVIATSASSGCRGILVDTHDKHGPGLMGLVPPETLRAWVQAARDAGMPIALAGKLSIGDLPTAARHGADLLAVRSAVCAASAPGMNDRDRLGVVSRAMVREAVAALNP